MGSGRWFVLALGLVSLCYYDFIFACNTARCYLRENNDGHSHYSLVDFLSSFFFLPLFVFFCLFFLLGHLLYYSMGYTFTSFCTYFDSLDYIGALPFFYFFFFFIYLSIHLSIYPFQYIMLNYGLLSLFLPIVVYNGSSRTHVLTYL